MDDKRFEEFFQMGQIERMAQDYAEYIFGRLRARDIHHQIMEAYLEGAKEGMSQGFDAGQDAARQGKWK